MLGLLFVLQLCLGGPAQAANELDEWRNEAALTRIWAENDAPRAYEQARRLHDALPAGAPPADRARALNLLSRIETYLALTEPAAAHAQQAFDLAAKNAERIGQAEADLNVALNAINQGRLDEMIRATQHSVAILEGVDRPDLLGEAMLRVAVMYRRFEEFDESVAVAVQAMEIARRSNNPLALTYAHQGLAIAYEQSYRLAETREHYQQMRTHAQAARSRLLEAFAVAGLASAQVNQGDFAGGERLSREAIGIYREVGAPFAVSFGLYGLAANLALQKRHLQAIKLLDEAIAIYERYPNRIGLWFALNARSSSHQAIGDVARANAEAERAYAVAKDLGLAIYLSGSATRLASIAATKGEHRRAYELSVEASTMVNKAAREKAGARMVQLIRRYEQEGKAREIAELTRRNEQQLVQLQQRELQQRWLWTLLAGIALLLAGAALFVIRLRRSQRALQALNAQLRRTEDDIRALNVQLEQRVHERTAELRQRKRYLRTLIDMLPMWAWFKDTDSRYLVVSEAQARARDQAVDDMEGKTDLELLPPEVAQRQRAEDQALMASRQRTTTQERISDGGVERWIETYRAPVLDEDGTVLGTVGVARDISERKAAESARETALAEATQLARQRSEFLAQMSHELRTPLNGILGFAHLLQRDKPLNERQLRGLNIIEDCGQHLLALIDDVLDLARIDAAKLDLFPAEVDVAAFLHIVCDIIRVKAEEKSVAFTHEAAPNLPRTILVDEKRLRQVLLNLLSNAVKFTDSGRVTLHVTRVRSSAAGAAAEATARLRFEVVDEGIGMSDAQLACLFEPFEQVAEAKRRAGGTGLGLAISRQLVRLMGGDIQVRSRPGEGSVFWFELELPALDTQLVVQPAHGVPIGYEGERRKILVVDDVPHNRAMLLDTLGVLGFELADAENGAEALEVAARFQPDLILMDLMMPVMDGYEATRRLRLTPQGARLPIIALSASASAQAQARSREAGADRFIAKPIEQPLLFGAIAALLNLAWIHAANHADEGERAID